MIKAFTEVAEGMVSTVGRGATSFFTMKRVATMGGKKKWCFIVKTPQYPATSKHRMEA